MKQFCRSLTFALALLPILPVAAGEGNLHAAMQPQLNVAPVLFEVEANARYASTDLKRWEVFTRDRVQLSRSLSIEFLNVDPAMKMEGVRPTGATLNIYQGNDPSKWKTNNGSYEAVAYRGLYRGIDLVYRRTENGLKGDFIVQPGADAAQIRFRFSGATVRLTNGELEIRPNGEAKEANMVERIPAVYEQDGAVRLEKIARYREFPDGAIGFEVEARDPRHELVIDPALSFSSYVAGSSLDQVTAMTYSSFERMLLVGGWTESSDLLGITDPTLFKGSIDGFYGRFAVVPGGAVTLSSMTLVGGSGTDKVTSIAVNAQGWVVVGGSTSSTNFPTRLPYQAQRSGTSDGFLIQFFPFGSTMVFSTYFGGTGGDQITGVAIDSNYVVYFAGTTSSKDLPVPRDGRSGFKGGPTDGFVGTLNPNLTLGYLFCLGGTGTDSISSLAMLNGEVYLTGATDSIDFPAVNSFQSGNFTGATSGGGQDAFITKVSSAGAVVYSSYLGGNGGYTGSPETGNAIAVNSIGEAYITGITSSTNFPTTSGAVQVQPNFAYGVTDAFLSKFSSTGGLAFSTYLGGTSWDQGNAVTVLRNGYVAIAGMTTSLDFPTLAALQPAIGSSGSYDAFVSIFTAAGALVYSSYFGGAGSDAAYAIASSPTNDLFIGGLTGSFNLPKVNALQTYINSSGYHGFVAKFNPIDLFGVFRPSSKQFILSPAFNAATYAVYSWSNVSCLNPQPVVGDWDNTGWNRIGLYCDGTWYLDLNGDNLYSAGVDRVVTNFGFVGAQPVVGDWDNTGKVRLGFFQNGLWYLDLVGDYVLRYTAQSVFSMGGAGDFAIAGDFANNGQTHLGVVRFNHWLVDLTGDHVGDTNYNFGSPHDKFLFADWDHTGVKRIGIFRQTPGEYPPGWWFIDITGNNFLDNPIFPCIPDRCFSNGIPNDLPIVGIGGSWRL